MALQKQDFIEIEYVGTVDDNILFDTTSAEAAKKHGVYNEKAAYRPTIICIGESQVVPGLDEFLGGKEVGKQYMVKVPSEKGFGKKDVKLIRLVPMHIFQGQNIKPMPGLQLNIDGVRATVLRVSGGRIMVDFNHPLAGKDLTYEIAVKRKVTDQKEQIASYIKNLTGLQPEVSLEENNAEIKLSFELPKEIADNITKKLKELTKIGSVKFTKEKDEVNEIKKPKVENKEKRKQ